MSDQDQFAIGSPVKKRICKDCLSEGRVGTALAADFPGPRCYNHARKFKKIQRGKNHERMVTKTYGLAPGEYEQLCVFQGGLCAICRRAKCVGVSGKHLAVDHDHATLAPRGLLCVTCNKIVIGQYNVESLARAIAYLQDPPYSQMLRSQ